MHSHWDWDQGNCVGEGEEEEGETEEREGGREGRGGEGRRGEGRGGEGRGGDEMQNLMRIQHSHACGSQEG